MVKAKRAYHHGDLKATLVRTALELIVEHGIQGFSLKDAALRAGVSIAAPYRHFADKQALLGTIAAEGFAAFDTALATAFAGGRTPRSRVEAMGLAYVRFALEHPAHFRVMFTRSAGEAEEHKTAGSMDGFRLLQEGVAQLYPRASAGTREARVVALWSVVHGFALLELEGAFTQTMGHEDFEARLRRALGTIVE